MPPSSRYVICSVSRRFGSGSYSTTHKLAKFIYTMLRYGREYVDAGAEYYEKRYQCQFSW